MVYRQNMTWRQIHTLIHVSQMLDRPISASKPKFWYLHGSQFWVFCTLHLSGAGWSRLLWGVLPAALGMTVPDGPASADSLSTGGTGVDVLLFSTPAKGSSSHPALCWSWREVNSSYVGFGCALHCPWGVPHKLVHWDRATFLQHTPYFPICPEFYDDFWRWLHGLEPCLWLPRPLPYCTCHNCIFGAQLPLLGRSQPFFEPIWHVP